MRMQMDEIDEMDAMDESYMNSMHSIHIQKDTARVGCVRNCSSVVSGVGLPD